MLSSNGNPTFPVWALRSLAPSWCLFSLLSPDPWPEQFVQSQATSPLIVLAEYRPWVLMRRGAAGIEPTTFETRLQEAKDQTRPAPVLPVRHRNCECGGVQDSQAYHHKRVKLAPVTDPANTLYISLRYGFPPLIAGRAHGTM